MKILVTGGAGYIGSITVRSLQNAGHEVVVFDNLICGHKEALINTPLIIGDLLNKEKINSVFQNNKYDAVIHFAAYALAQESMEDPKKYFENNIQGGLNLLEAMRKGNCDKIIFSSTCAVYGYPDKLPVTEKEKFAPVSVYGESKLAFEKILNWYDQIFNIKHISLRYFNAAGATLDGSLGENHQPETHLIPLLLQTALGKKEIFSINGNDYPTKDGTCIRDYIHVADLAEAHIKALEKLNREINSQVYNIGSEKAVSVKEVITMVEKVTGVIIPTKIIARRQGDPAAIWADSTRIKKELGWEPKYSDLRTIIETAWKWHENHEK